MNQEDSIDEDAYHYDFTTASEWEIFIARLEEIIHDWELNVNRNLVKPLKENQLLDGTWLSKSENVLFADVEFSITRYYLESEEASNDTENDATLENESDKVKLQALEDMMAPDNDFIPITYFDGTSRPHTLARWYGLREFVVLAPIRNNTVTSESKIKILLSSICIAINNSNCEVPMFVQVLETWQNFFMGICEGRGIRSEFEMVHLKRIPPQCKHLTGLLNLFKSRLGITSTLQVDPVRIAARFAYKLRDWTNYVWSQEPPDFDFLQGEVGVADLGTLPFGATFDPVSELTLYAVWPDILETGVVDSETYTDLEPNQAPNWFASVDMADKPNCLLSEYLAEFLHLCTVQQSMYSLLGDLIQDTGPDLTASFNKLTEPRVPTISKVLLSNRNPKRKEKINQGPIANDMLMPLLYFLFPDADMVNDQPRCPYPETIGNAFNREPNSAENVIGSGMKSAPVDSLVWRLAVLIAHVVHTLGGVKAAAHLWYEFCQELRYRWDQGILIPGVTPGFPDSKTCLLNQKLQMLNCCIDRKNAKLNAALANPDNQSDESEDDEFYDCSTEENCDEQGNEQVKEKSKPKHSLWNRPVGRHCRYGNLRLIKTDEYLYIPITQDATPKTEDQLEEDAEVLLQLGTDELGTQLRSRLMSASLLSDMESFKAANPDSILEDFIRWYSPRDWIEDKEGDENNEIKGSLSARMQIPGNMWLEMWAAAKPVPAKRQKRLFDDTREAEKILHQFESKQPSSAAQLMLSTLVHAVLLRLAQQAIPVELPGLTPAIKHMSNKVEILSHVLTSDITKYLEICGEIACAEAMVAQVTSLEHKLCPGKGQTCEMRGFLASLVTQPQAAIPGGPHSEIGNRIRAMFSEAHKVAQMIYESDSKHGSDQGEPWSPLSASVFPTPAEKEFILRVNIPRPSPCSMVVSHRLSVRIRKEDVTMAGCFSQDTTFQ